MSDLYGPSVSPGDVAQAVLHTLQAPPAGSVFPLIVYYLADRERKAGLNPRALSQPETYRPAADFTAWAADQLPMIIATAKPLGAPDRIDSTQYAQVFDVQVGAVVKATDSELDAYVLADQYGIALTKAILEHGTLGVSAYDSTAPFATETRLAELPTPEFAMTATEARNVMHSIATFAVRVAPVLENVAGPTAFPPDPYMAPGDWPTVAKTNVTVTAVPLSSQPLGS